MSSQFSVDLDHLEEIVSRLSGLAGFIGEHLDEIDYRVATLTNTGWEGIAAQAYSEAHREWSTGARAFVEGVRDMSDAARKAHGQHSGAIDLVHKMTAGG